MKKLLLIFLSAILFSCGSEKQEVVPAAPDDVVSEEKMVDVLVDLHLMEASLSLKMLEDHRTVKDTTGLYDPYKKHGVAREQFEASFKYYAAQPQKLNAIYEDVLDRLNQRQAEVMKSIPKDSTGKPINPGINVPRHRPGLPGKSK